MAEFLSEAWLASVEARIGRADPALHVRVEQQIAGAPSGDVRYALVVFEGTVRVERDPAQPADLTLQTDYQTAAALWSGAVSIGDALQAGAIRVRGDLRRLPDAAAALAPLRDASEGGSPRA